MSLEQWADKTERDAFARIAARHPDVPREQIEKNVNLSLRIAYSIPPLAIALLCFWALDDHPYGYFTLLRVVVTAGAIGAALWLVSLEREWSAVGALVFGAVAFLFNPVFPVYMSREIWKPIDVTVGALFVALALAIWLIKPGRGT